MDDSSVDVTRPDSPGLRQSKRQRTRARILANAIALFREHGLRPTRLAEIAQASDVSPATLFNYFPTKGALAEAWVRGELESTLAEATREAVGAERSLRAALRTAAGRVARATAVEPALRLEAWQNAGRAPAPPLPGASPAARRALVEGVAREQEREHVRADLTADALADLLLDAIEGGLIRVLIGPGAEHDAERAAGPGDSGLEVRLQRAAQARIDLVLDGARKRNERVRPPARSR